VRGDRLAQAADVVLPGARAAVHGDWRGLAILLLWLALISLCVTRWERMIHTVRAGGPDEWLALITTVAGLAGAWLLARSWRVGASPPADPSDDDRSARSSESQWALAWRAFRRHRQAMLGLGLVLILGLAALLTPYLAPFNPAAQGADIVATRFQPPSATHLMGTDRFGRDVFSRVLYGARISLSIGFLAVAIAISLGTLLGALSGYVRGWFDTLSMRFVDLLLSFPRLVLLVTMAALFTPSIFLVTLILGLTGWMGVSRIVRGEVLSVREREFIVAARALGFRNRRILLRHVIPSVLSPVIVAATLGIGNTILAEAALSFLGLGVPPPAASWGSMVASGRDVMTDAWWITTFPGMAIVLTVMSFNLVGDGLRDALDPRATTIRAS
jgi:peptide/nickel transport system permease protein